MGFGLLLLGYLFAIDIISCNLLFPAGALMFYALSKLSFVNKSFEKAKYYLLPLMGIGFASVILLCLSMTSGKEYALWYSYLGALSKLFMLLFLLKLLSGIRQLSVELSLKNLEIRAFRNQFYAFIFYIPAFLVQFDFGKHGVFLAYLTVIFVFIGFIIYFMNAKLLFDCYRIICMPEDVDMPQKPSRFQAVNEYRQRKEEAHQAALEAEQERVKARRAQRQNKKKRGKR